MAAYFLLSRRVIVMGCILLHKGCQVYFRLYYTFVRSIEHCLFDRHLLQKTFDEAGIWSTALTVNRTTPDLRTVLDQAMRVSRGKSSMLNSNIA